MNINPGDGNETGWQPGVTDCLLLATKVPRLGCNPLTGGLGP